MSLNFIEDGQTETRFLAEVPGIHGPCRFMMRPMQAIELTRLLDRMQGLTGEAARRISAKELAARITQWDLMMKQGNDEVLAPITDERLLRLPPRMFKKFEDIVCGYEPGDIEDRRASLGN